MGAVSLQPRQTTLALRDALVRALVTPSPDGGVRAHIVRLENEVASLFVCSTRAMLFLVTVEPGAAGQLALRRRIDRIIRGRRPGTTHLVLIGGGDEHRRMLTRIRPRFAFEKKLVVHQVVGTETWSAGGRLPELDDAMRESADAPTSEPLSPAELEASRERLHRATSEDGAFVSALLRRWPVASWTLIALMLTAFALELLWGGPRAVSTLWRMGANVPDRVALGEGWRLLSSAFVHTSAIHLVVNAFALWSLGGVIERLLGARRLLVLFTLSTLAGGAASAFAHRTDMSVGASGGVFGLATFAFVLLLRHRALVPGTARAFVRRQLVPPLALAMASSIGPGTDLFAHAGGALSGLVLALSGWLTYGVRRPDEVDDRVASRLQPMELTVAAIVASVALSSAMGAALVSGKPWVFSAPPLPTRLPLADSGLSIEMPDVLAARPPERVGRSMRWVFGEELRDPLVVEVLLSPVTKGESIEVQYELLRRTLPPGEGGPAVKLEWQAGRPMIVFDRRTDTGMHLREWVTERGDWRVVLRALAMEHVPPGWAFARDRLVASLEETVRQ